HRDGVSCPAKADKCTRKESKHKHLQEWQLCLAHTGLFDQDRNSIWSNSAKISFVRHILNNKGNVTKSKLAARETQIFLKAAFGSGLRSQFFLSYELVAFAVFGFSLKRA
ncbi:MAG: hypothetical protein AB3N13_03530, partial [Arenibacterium sp.]